MATVIPSISDTGTFFIFRDNGIEVKVHISSKGLKASHHLSDEEREYFDNHILAIKSNSDFL